MEGLTDSLTDGHPGALIHDSNHDTVGNSAFWNHI